MNDVRIMATLKRLRNPRNIAGMARFGINPKNTLGISIPKLRALAKEIGRDHALAQKLWASGIHEARILASMVDEPARVTPAQMDRWVRGLDSWDVCDNVCGNLFDKTPHAWKKAIAWSKRSREFEKRAGFALMAYLAWHDKHARDAQFEKFLPHLARGATDERNFVKKAVNWALRQIGKRNRALNRAAIRIAREIAQKDSRAARWIAADALRELQGAGTRQRLK
ncbi:MAG: DNA alkylation repair protein [Chloroflexi bacterium]|nr:DNA alkylation repair protein [Chloroflexota bacterium]